MTRSHMPTEKHNGPVRCISCGDCSAIVCPGCGWTGIESGLSPTGACPRCEYENGSDPYRLLTVTELLADESGQYANVNMGKFLHALAPFLSSPNSHNSHNSHNSDSQRAPVESPILVSKSLPHEKIPLHR